MQNNKLFFAVLAIVAVVIISVFSFKIGGVNASLRTPIETIDVSAEDAASRARIDAQEKLAKEREEKNLKLKLAHLNLSNSALSLGILQTQEHKDSLNIWLEFYVKYFQEVLNLEGKDYLELTEDILPPKELLDDWVEVLDENGKKKFEVLFATDGALHNDPIGASAGLDAERETPAPMKYFVTLRRK